MNTSDEFINRYSCRNLVHHGGFKTAFENKRIIEKTGFGILPITTNQILLNAGLPYHHQDPFDRIIIAQAILENLKIVSKDGHFENYEVQLIWDK